jgi:UDP-glucose 4-epimerase
MGNAVVRVGDVAEPGALDAHLDRVDEVVYCIGRILPTESNLDPARDIALTLPPLINTLEVLRRRPGIRLTFLSSGGTVYGNPRKLPVHETDPTEPLTSYGITKLAAEKYISMYSDLYGLRAQILRCSNAYGPGQPANRGQGAVAVFLARQVAREPISLFGDGSVERDYIYIDDLAEAVVRLLDRTDGPRVVNVGSGRGTSLNGLLEMVATVTGTQPRIRHLPDRDFDVRHIVLDISRLRQLIDFDALPLIEGLRRTWREQISSPDSAADTRTATVTTGQLAG